jgi:hypothetical protein
LSFKERISKGIEGNGAIEHTEHPKRLQNNDRNDSFRGKD